MHARITLCLVLLGASFLAPVSATERTSPSVTDPDLPVVTAPPESFFQKVRERDREPARQFYRKYLDVQGLPVAAAEVVADRALQRTHEIVTHLLAGRPDLLSAMASNGMYLIIIGKDQVYTDMPEYRNSPNPVYQNERVRGTGGEPTSFGEENLLSLPLDRYDDESIAVHEFCHTIDATLRSIDAGWTERKNQAYRNALAKGLYDETYAGSNPGEYWAEIAQSYFDCNRVNNWNHGPVGTREQLKAYDPEGYELVRSVFNLSPAQDWRYSWLQPLPNVIVPPAKLGLDPYYTKFTCAREFTVVGRQASEEALLKSNDTIRKLFAYRHDILKALMAEGVKLVVLGRNEHIRDLPEFKNRTSVGGVDTLSRVLEYAPETKLLVVGEENVLARPGDALAGDCQVIRLFARGLHAVTGTRPVDPNWETRGRDMQQYELRVKRLDVRFDQKLQELYEAAMANGLWKGTYAVQGRWTIGLMACLPTLRLSASNPRPAAARLQSPHAKRCRNTIRASMHLPRRRWRTRVTRTGATSDDVTFGRRSASWRGGARLCSRRRPDKVIMKRLLFVMFVAGMARITASAADPNLGANVFVFDPGGTDIQQRVHAVFREQERAQFGRGRYALLFKPGRYELDLPVGFYTHVAGLGRLPGDVTVSGGVGTDAAWMNRNATCNFWRTVENLTVVPTNGANMWAVSQAAPLRRAHIRGDLLLSSGGWSSGGFMADCRVDGVVKAGSQQQWFSRNSGWKEWIGINWNMVFLGCENPPDGEWPNVAVTRIKKTPAIREKPFLTVENGRWFVKVPPLRREGAEGLTWERGESPGDLLPLDKFYIAKPESANAAAINAALRAGKHLLLTPGIYPLEDTIVVPHPGTVIFGLGLTTLTPITGKTALRVEAGEGVLLSGVVVDAGPAESETLLQIGLPGRRAGTETNPTAVYDLVCRVGGYGPGKAKVMVAIHDSHVMGDNFWLWRADHGAAVGWTQNTCETGLCVEGDDVTIYGLFVEHTQGYQTLWNGNGGRVFFYQSEMPYDPPSQEAWRSPASDGFPSYRVADAVTTHEAWGLGVYHVFKRAAVVAENAIETPSGPGIKMRHMMTFRLGGGKPGSGIRHVVNGTGGEAILEQKAMVP